MKLTYINVINIQCNHLQKNVRDGRKKITISEYHKTKQKTKMKHKIDIY